MTDDMRKYCNTHRIIELNIKELNMRKIYHKILRFIFRHRLLNKTIGKTKWFKKEVNKESRWILNHIPYD